MSGWREREREGERKGEGDILGAWSKYVKIEDTS